MHAICVGVFSHVHAGMCSCACVAACVCDVEDAFPSLAFADSSQGLGTCLRHHAVCPEHRGAHFTKIVMFTLDSSPRLLPRCNNPDKGLARFSNPTIPSFHRWGN